MSRVILLPSKKVLASHPGETIYTLLRRYRIPIGASCGGDGVCDRCRVQVVEGMKNLSRINRIEARLKRDHGFEPDERVSCQTVIHGDIVITTGYW